ncbi:transporter substrate-binding domain-containing protein [Bifidobacterium xylocopae]|nr:transporter substrate-binding domain-containing protein [Bifidobacterium xylocopae]
MVLITRRLIALLTVLSLATVLAGCGGQSSTYDVSSIGPKVHIGVLADQPGLGFTRSGQRSGLDIDVARYILHELGFVPSQIVWSDLLPAQREEALESGRVDMILAGYSITGPRSQRVDFAGPYFISGQDLLIRKADRRIRGVGDLGGRRVCAVAGSTSVEGIIQRVPQAQVRERDRIGACVTALLSGDADAVTGDGMALAGASAVMGGGQLALLGATFTSERYGVAVRHGQPELVAAIDKALDHMMTDGSWMQSVRNAASGIGFEIDPKASRPIPPVH